MMWAAGFCATSGLAAIARRLTVSQRSDTLEFMQKGRLKFLYPARRMRLIFPIITGLFVVPQPLPGVIP